MSMDESSGGRGGGALSLIVNSTAQSTLQLKGKIASNGIRGEDGFYGGGGGSGGSVFITCTPLEGPRSGVISANGGRGGTGSLVDGNPGRGGRIAVLAKSMMNFHSSVHAFGGVSQTTAGVAGTLFFQVEEEVPDFLSVSRYLDRHAPPVSLDTY